MNTIPSHKKVEPGNSQVSEEIIQESIYPNQHEINITDGGEFLDDGIRMKDQPYVEYRPEENE